MSDCSTISCSRSSTVSTVMLPEWSIFVHTGFSEFQTITGMTRQLRFHVQEICFPWNKKTWRCVGGGAHNLPLAAYFWRLLWTTCEATSIQEKSSSFLEKFFFMDTSRANLPHLWRICGSRQMGDVSLYLHIRLRTFPVTGSQLDEYSVRVCMLN